MLATHIPNQGNWPPELYIIGSIYIPRTEQVPTPRDQRGTQREVPCGNHEQLFAYCILLSDGKHQICVKWESHLDNSIISWMAVYN